jgi:hypothetical protein
MVLRRRIEFTYRTSVVEGTILGRKVAQWVAKFHFQPVGAHIPRGPKGD